MATAEAFRSSTTRAGGRGMSIGSRISSAGRLMCTSASPTRRLSPKSLIAAKMTRAVAVEPLSAAPVAASSAVGR